MKREILVWSHWPTAEVCVIDQRWTKGSEVVKEGSVSLNLEEAKELRAKLDGFIEEYEALDNLCADMDAKAIKVLGKIDIDGLVVGGAEVIRHQNHQISTPVKYQKRTLVGDMRNSVIGQLSTMVGIDAEVLDAVYFSSPNGADPHRDMLSPEEFDARTFLIPVIVPRSGAVLTVGNDDVRVEVGVVYEFDHQTVHSLVVGDTSGCVMIMVAIKVVL